jgi:hypothetical protein
MVLNQESLSSIRGRLARAGESFDCTRLEARVASKHLQFIGQLARVN